MDSETIEPVLLDILADLKESNRLNKENGIVAVEIRDSLIALEKKLDEREKTLTADTRPIEQLVSKAMNTIATIVEKSKEKRRAWFQFKFFPEHSTMEYYKFVYGKILFWVAMLFIAYHVYLLGSQWINKSYDLQKYEQQNKQVLNSLYHQQAN